MVVFLDTSALAKRYIGEAGTVDVNNYFSSSNSFILSPITPIEFSSMIYRRLRDKSIPLEAINEILAVWQKEQPFFQYISFNPDIVQTAILVIERIGIKTLDAIQLASAYTSQSDEFVTADKALFRAAEKFLLIKSTLIG
ncbi:MAG: hypothetical protein DRP70_09190 [Spirochaetes bacterium]|nr:MAG: hypothetical protein DRP60_17140 [Spirochaetota bacterium]RKX87103.1 MAG: hypothetical protein DRP70_09190 [Spirochaetota bacterium]